MKRFLCALLAVLMLCTMTVAMVSCGVSIESMEEKCKKLKEDGEIEDYYVSGNVISVEGKDGAMLSAEEYDSKDAAKTAEEQANTYAALMGMTVVRKGNVVIAYTSETLYKKIV